MGITVLSLFDGMSCGQIALKELGIKVDRYYASEIDKHAIKQTQLNFPDTVQLGSVIVPNHYSHKAVANSCINLVVLYHGKIEGALQIGYGIRPKIKGDLDPKNTREFDRMWLSDKMPTEWKVIGEDQKTGVLEVWAGGRLQRL